MKSKQLFRLIPLLVISFLASCAEDKPLNTFEPESDQAREIYDVMMPLVWVLMTIVFVLVVGGTLLIVFRRKIDPETEDLEDLPEQVHGNSKLEWAWTIAPFLLLAALAFPTIGAIWALEEKNAPDELDVMVIGQQWWWEYRYDVDGDGFFQDANKDGVVDEKDEKLPMELSLDPDDVVTANELVIPVNQQVDLKIGSRDVIHSFWIPRLNGKRDAVPGRWHTWSISADRVGKFTGWCTEFCGVSHARMRMSSVVLEPEEFSVWLENQKKPAQIPEDEDALAGRELFVQQCSSCHVIKEDNSNNKDVEVNTYPENFTAPLDSKAAPNLTHFASRSTYAGGTYSIYKGTGQASDDELKAEDYNNLSDLADKPDSGYEFNKYDLQRWVSDASSQKDMDPDSLQGMTSFPQFDDEQLSQIVSYLESLE